MIRSDRRGHTLDSQKHLPRVTQELSHVSLKESKSRLDGKQQQVQRPCGKKYLAERRSSCLESSEVKLERIQKGGPWGTRWGLCSVPAQLEIPVRHSSADVNEPGWILPMDLRCLTRLGV